MANKAKKAAGKAEPVIFPRKSVPIYMAEDINEDQKMGKYAELTTSSNFAAFRVIKGVEEKDGLKELLDVPALMRQLQIEAKAVNSGDLRQAEAMLMNQATALQSLFSRLAERGMGCDQAAGFEINMRMALRAQNQCRATLETLAAIKNPPIIYAKQLNQTTGPQQVNNGQVAPAHVRESENEQSKLSGGENVLLPDARTPALEGGTNKEMEALGKVHRAKIRRG